MTTTPTLMPETEVEISNALDGLRRRGYVIKKSHNELRAGARVRHRGHQYPEALRYGTGMVLHVTEKSPSAWSVKWGVPDVEMIVLWDNPGWLFGAFSMLAQYHVQYVCGGNA